MSQTVLSPPVAFAPTAGSAGPVLEACGLGVRYGDRKALSGITFAVKPGESFGVLGPNGGGKSTLFRVLSTLIPPQEGTLRFFGREPARDRLLVRRRLGVVFQSPSLDPYLSVRENLLHHGHLYGLRGASLARRITEGLGQVSLLDRAGDRVRTLSGGLKRRVEIAKALLTRPDLLVLDEPSTGLDPGIRRELSQLLSALRVERGITVVLTTHLMDEAASCDRLAVLDRGELIALDTPAALLERVGGDVILFETPDPELLARDLEPRFGVKAAVIDGALRVEHPRGHEFAAQVAGAFPEHLQSIAVRRPTLEDVFTDLTGRSLAQADAEASPPGEKKSK